MVLITRVIYVSVSLPGGQPVLLNEIIVPLDGSNTAERAVPIAADLAGRLGAGIRLMTTKSDVHDQSPSAYLDSVAAAVTGRVDVSTDIVLDAEPAASIVAAMQPGGVGVCMTTHAPGRLLGALHASIADEVVDARTGPVFLVGPACTRSELGDRPVLCAHDGSADATSRLLGLVPVLAALSSSLMVMTVVPAPSGKSAEDPFREIKRIVQPVLDRAAEHQMSATHRLDFGFNVRRGVLDEISTVDPSLVVLAAHHHTAMERLREGSTTSAILHRSPVPVLVT